MDVIYYPTLTQELGGALSTIVGKRSVIVEVQGKTYQMPLREAKPYLNDGLRIAEEAKAWAYRNA